MEWRRVSVKCICNYMLVGFHLTALFVGVKCYHNYMLVYYMCVAYATHNYMLVYDVLCVLPMQRITTCWCDREKRRGRRV